MPNYVTVTSKFSKKKAYTICLIGGIFGLHYWYVGRRFRAIISLFTFNLALFGWMHDLSKIRRGRFKDCYGDYLKE